MSKFFFIAIFFSSFGMQNIFAAAPQCPNFSEIKPTADEIVSKIDQCLEARANRTSNTIEDFQCPAGEFALEDRAELTNERLAYYIATNFFMNEADAKVKQYMQQLQRYRDKDPVAWTQAYGSCILGKGDETQKSLAYFYDTICQFLGFPIFWIPIHKIENLEFHQTHIRRKFVCLWRRKRKTRG